ncbi:MAG: protein kinase [Pseudomonadales bacterium]
MALQLFEGQDIGAHYSLLRRITESEVGENWLALDKDLNERVVLKIFREPLNESTRTLISANLSSLKGLIHPNIARIYNLEEHEGTDFVSCQYISAARPWEPSAESFTAQWPFLKQVFDALEFAHGLSLAHGHLHPGNLLIDDQDNLYISDFGLPADLHHNHQYRDYLSPQIRQGQSADVTDDIYSLGSHLFQALTGRPWHPGESFKSDSPIPDDVRRVVSQMLQDSPYERPSRIGVVREIIEQHASSEETARPIEIHRPGFIGRSTNQTYPEPNVRASTSPAPAHRLPRERRLISSSVALAGLAILILLAGGIFFLLPENESRPELEPIVPETTSPATETQIRTPDAAPERGPIENARLERLKEKGKEIANEVVRLQIRLEDRGVRIWAPEEYRQISAQASQGDDLYREGEYRKAIEAYESATTAYQELLDKADTVKNDNIEAGEEALANGDVQTALEAYSILTALEPDNETFQKGLERAENLDQVLSHMQAGRQLENQGHLTDALERFRKARELDPQWKPAPQAINRTRDKIAQQEFTDAMSQGFMALAEDEYERAQEAFSQARKIFPDSREPDDGLNQVALAKKLDTIEAHKEAAEEYELSEQWPKAIEEYEAALSMDDTLTFARDGIERATHRLEINRELDKYLDRPTLMQADEELSAARSAIAKASRLENPGPKLKRKVDKLSRYVSVAREPVSLQVTSDNKTDVTVYKVGHLGKIETRELELHPGEYTIVGKREGYRDVRKTVTLLADQETRSVHISCTEKI